MTSRASDQTIYEFGAFRLDPAERLLVRNGQPVPLTPKAFDLLVYLVERHGRLVEKRALLSALWPTTVVEEANLAYNMSALRKVLDEERGGPSAIETVPTKGYRFVLPVAITARTAPISEGRQKSSRSVWGAAVALLLIVSAGTAWLLRSGWPVFRPVGEHLREPSVTLTPLTVGLPGLPVQSAVISPDGKYLAYTNPSGIQVMAIDSDETHRISDVRGIRVLGWTADSTRIHVLDADGTGWDVAPVGGAWQRSGFNLPEDVFVSIAPDSSAWVSVNKQRELCVTPRQGAGRPVVRLGQEEFVMSVAWTPDAQRVYFVRSDGARLETFAVQGGSVAVAFQAQPNEAVRFVGPVTAAGRLMVLMGSRSRAYDISVREISIDARTGMPIGGPRWLTDWREAFGCCLNVTASAGGRRVVFFTTYGQPEMYVANFDEGRGRIDDPKRLTRSGIEIPWAWLPDNRTLIFSKTSGIESQRTEIVKQDIETGATAPLVTVNGNLGTPRVTPDGRWLLFVRYPDIVIRPGFQDQIMRAPIEGGMAEEIAATMDWTVVHCSLATTCVLIDTRGVYRLDAVKGKGVLLGTLPANLAGASLSADGAELYYVLNTHGRRNRIQVLSLVGKPPREIAVPDATNLGSIEALPDGSGWLAANTNPQSDRDQLLYVSADGHSRVLWAPGHAFGWGIPSHDGKHLAILALTPTTGAWLLSALR